MGKVYLICKSYVYESESYWDKEKKQPRSKRTLIGKLDEETGEIIPTGKSGRRKAGSENQPTDDAEKKPITDQVKLLAEKDEQIRILKCYSAFYTVPESTVFQQDKESPCIK